MVRTTSTSPEIQKGIEKIYELNADTILRKQIRQRDKAIRDYENDIAVVEERGIAKGRAEAVKNLMHFFKIDEIKAKELLGLA